MRFTAAATPLTILVGENAGLITQGIDVIESVPSEVYANNSHAHFDSGAGKHFRHILDFYDRLLSGWQSIIDYDTRNRDERVEHDSFFAAESARQIVGRLEEKDRQATSQHTNPPVGTAITVRSEIRDGNNKGLVVQSTLERELANLASHTIHHYAIIALVLRIQGHDTPASFGIAPSTLRHMVRQEQSG